MSIFRDIAYDYAISEAALADAEVEAFENNDDTAFDRAGKARQRNDQAYFLYLFTRFEAEVNSATEALLAKRTDAATAWPERRVWQAWGRPRIGDIVFLSKVEVLTDKGTRDYAQAREYYEGRNKIAHGGDWELQFSVPDIAQQMNDLVQRFVRT